MLVYCDVLRRDFNEADDLKSFESLESKLLFLLKLFCFSHEIENKFVDRTHRKTLHNHWRLVVVDQY